MVQEAYVQGVSTRRVDDLVRSMGMTGISKSQVSRLCAGLDGEVERFRNRGLEGTYPYIWLDATALKVRRDGRVVSMAVVIAIGVNVRGDREVLGLDVGPSEDGAFWLSFLRGLVARGLTRVQLVISDAHEGLKAAIASILTGSELAAVPGAFCAQCPCLCPQGRPADGSRDYANRLHSAEYGSGAGAMAPGGGQLSGPVSTSV